MRRLESLVTLRDRLAALEAIQCHMHHERVERAPSSLLPLRDPSIPEHGYKRTPYCRQEMRRERLGCAHSSARMILKDALMALEARNGGRSGLTEELNALELRIYQIDRQRSDAEIAHARTSEQLAVKAVPGNEVAQQLEGALRAIEEKIRTLEQAHDACITQLDAIRNHALADLSRLIEKTGTG